MDSGAQIIREVTGTLSTVSTVTRLCDEARQLLEEKLTFR